MKRREIQQWPTKGPVVVLLIIAMCAITLFFVSRWTAAASDDSHSLSPLLHVPPILDCAQSNTSPTMQDVQAQIADTTAARMRFEKRYRDKNLWGDAKRARAPA